MGHTLGYVLDLSIEMSGYIWYYVTLWFNRKWLSGPAHRVNHALNSSVKMFKGNRNLCTGYVRPVGIKYDEVRGYRATCSAIQNDLGRPAWVVLGGL